MNKSREDIIESLVNIQYKRNDINFVRTTFRVRGDIIEVIPAAISERAIRIELFGDEIEKISEIDALTGRVTASRNHVVIFPASHYVKDADSMQEALVKIEEEMISQIEKFTKENKLIEAQRIRERTLYDMEMLKEIGFCSGIENYARILENRPIGSRPSTLIDYFPKDFLLVIDESHATIPQIRAMYKGDRSRKTTLVDYGFRIPSALDNRPLNFEEFESLTDKVLYMSATPAEYEREKSTSITEQVIRPTGLLDPVIEIRPSEAQIDDLYAEINRRVELGERVLVTTLTKKMAEDLTNYLEKMGLKVRYMHSDIDTIERMEIVHDLRLGLFDTLVGINLLREGLDIPEVSLVAILDADKEGFLRSETSLIQTIGRAARHVNGRVIMYADKISKQMHAAIDETERRRKKQEAYNLKHGITPEGIKKAVRDVIEAGRKVQENEEVVLSDAERIELLEELEVQMKLYADALEFEKAANLRDEIAKLKRLKTK